MPVCKKLLDNKLAETPAAANRCIALIDAIWNMAVRTGEISPLPTPTTGLGLYPEEGRDRYLTAEEMKRLGKALHLAETTGLPWTVNEAGPKSKHLAKLENRQRIIDPHAVERAHGEQGIDGTSAAAAMDSYDKSFRAPTPSPNAFVIGVGSGSSGGGQ